MSSLMSLLAVTCDVASEGKSKLKEGKGEEGERGERCVGCGNGRCAQGRDGQIQEMADEHKGTGVCGNQTDNSAAHLNTSRHLMDWYARSPLSRRMPVRFKYRLRRNVRVWKVCDGGLHISVIALGLQATFHSPTNGSVSYTAERQGNRHVVWQAAVQRVVGVNQGEKLARKGERVRRERRQLALRLVDVLQLGTEIEATFGEHTIPGYRQSEGFPCCIGAGESQSTKAELWHLLCLPGGSFLSLATLAKQLRAQRSIW